MNACLLKSEPGHKILVYPGVQLNTGFNLPV